MASLSSGPEMDPSSRSLYYCLQNTMPIGMGTVTKTTLMQDTSGYALAASGAGMAGGYPVPSNTSTITPPTTNLDVTMMVQCSSTDVVVVVGRLSWQCCSCQENHGLDVSIDKHMLSKHSLGFEAKSFFSAGGACGSACEVLTPLHAFQDTDVTRADESYRGGMCPENKLLPDPMQSQLPHSDSTQTAVSLIPSIDEQAAGGGNSRSGLEREVALLMAQTFTQTSDTLPQEPNQKSMDSCAQSAADQESEVLAAEKVSIEEKPELAPSGFSTVEEQAGGAIFRKLIDKVEKAISYVADSEAQNGLLLVATQLARMKAQAKSKRSRLKQDHSYINCPQCGKEVRNKKAYIKQHNRSHEKGKAFRCSVCNKMFKYRSTLRRHVQQQGHSGEVKDEGNMTAVELISSLLESSRQERESTATSELSAADVWDAREESGDDHHDALAATLARQCQNGVAQNQSGEQMLSGEPAYEKILAALLAKGEQARSPNGKKLSLVQCFVCDREVRNRNYYITRHARCHADDMLYTCTSCRQQFFRSDYFQQHLLQHGRILPKNTEVGSIEGDLGQETVSKTQQDGRQIDLTPTPVTPLRRSLRSQKRSCMSKPYTVPCKICGKDIFNRTYNIKRHACQHSIFEWESILSKSSPKDVKEGVNASSWKSVYDKLRKDSRGKGRGQFHCQQCSKSFKKYGDKRRHMMQHRSKFICLGCQDKFESYAGLRSHQQSCTFYASAALKRRVSAVKSSNLWKQQTGKPSLQEKYTCGICSAQIIKTKHSIERHMRELHSEGQVHACSKCGRTYDSYHKMQRHVKSHGDTGGICHVCGKVFMTKQALRNHTKLHAGPEGMYQCASCPKSFRFQGLLDRHMRKHTEETEVCPHCGKIYISKVHLQRHISVVHLGVKDYRYKCDQCGAQFFESIQLRDHVAYRHQGIQLYRCKYCNRGFNCRPTMVRHERKTHTGYLPYVCKHCNLGFPEKSKLVAHEMTHTGMSPHQCDVCNKYFTTGSALRSHKNLHLGIKPYCCSICSKAYIKRWHLHQHMRKTHATIEVGWQTIGDPSCLQPAPPQLAAQHGDIHVSVTY